MLIQMFNAENKFISACIKMPTLNKIFI